MKVFSYDIFDGDKGIIFAEDYGQAYNKFKAEYGNEYPIYPEECDDYVSQTCQINEIGTYGGGTQLMYLYN